MTLGRLAAWRIVVVVNPLKAGDALKSLFEKPSRLERAVFFAIAVALYLLVATLAEVNCGYQASNWQRRLAVHYWRL